MPWNVDHTEFTPHLDPDDPELEIYADSMGRIRRRATRVTNPDLIRALERVRPVLEVVVENYENVRAMIRCGEDYLTYLRHHEGSMPGYARLRRITTELKAQLDSFFNNHPNTYTDEYGNRHLRRCDFCGDLSPLVAHRYAGGNRCCVACDAVAECDRCHISVPHRFHLSVAGTRRLCPRCVAELSRSCDGCRSRNFEDLTRGADGGMYCRSCATRSFIHNHSWSPATRQWLHLPGEKTISDPQTKRTLTDTAHYFGMEIEIESKSRALEEGVSIAISSGLFYCKQDGSISYGFEMVSHPFTWAWLQSNLPALDVLSKLSAMGYRGFKTVTCGMHVHMSKATISQQHMYKLLRLVYASPAFIALVARRDGGSLRQWANPDLTSNPAYRSLSSAAKEKFMEGRYRALNLTNDNTIEMRIFRSTLSPNGVLQNLEFCKAALDYTKRCSIAESNNVTEFVKHVMWSNEYKHLATYFKLAKTQQTLVDLGIIGQMSAITIGSESKTEEQ